MGMSMRSVSSLLGAAFAVLLSFETRSAEKVRFEVDFAVTNGTLRPLHGVNKGPIAAGGTIDLTRQHQELGIPFTRLHDCLWPYPDVVDIHAIFRNPAADPEVASNYDFALTDEYVAAVHRTGAKMIYRLGESIEHMATKRFVHPPENFEKWAEVGVGIIRHYNEGWANGFRYDIPYIEIWNEPENRPAMWSGSDEDFLRLYATSARRIKQRFPNLKVGGPGFGATGRWKDGMLEPTEFLMKFLKLCRSENVPLDFLSWHCYTADVKELAGRASQIRKLLDREGFRETESHLNEWNYLPDNSWDAFGKTAEPARRRAFYERAQGAEGAAFVLASLIQLQDAGVDVANFFHGEIGGFGMFDEFGGETEVYRAFRMFNSVYRKQSRRVQVKANRAESVSILACRETGGAMILLSNPTTNTVELEITMMNLALTNRPKTEIDLIPAQVGESRPSVTVAGNKLSLSVPQNVSGIIQFVGDRVKP